jgi:hypothetical protein
MFKLVGVTQLPWQLTHLRNIAGATGKPIATTFQHSEDTETCLADARLMTVAPEMFDQLAQTLVELEKISATNLPLDATIKDRINHRIPLIQNVLIKATTAQLPSQPAQ